MPRNVSIFRGRLGKDPEAGVTVNQKEYVRFNLAVTEKYGRGQVRTDWIPCVIWGKLSHVASKYLGKGSEIYVQGKLRTGSYEKNGVKHKSFEVWVDEFDFVTTKEPTQDTPLPDDDTPPF